MAAVPRTPLVEAWMEWDPAHLRIPIRTLTGANPSSTAALIDLFYLSELQHQAAIVNLALARAIRLAQDAPQTGRAELWADIQAALFAAIIVERLLLPGRTQATADSPQATTQARAYARGDRLRALVGVEDGDHDRFRVSRVRHPLEHIDERLDQIVADGIASICDRYVTSGIKMRSPLLDDPETTDWSGLSLRCFHYQAGLLYYDSAVLDVFDLDLNMLRLRLNCVEAVNDLEPQITGRSRFGGQQLVRVEQDRRRWWLDTRAPLENELDRVTKTASSESVGSE